MSLGCSVEEVTVFRASDRHTPQIKTYKFLSLLNLPAALFSTIPITHNAENRRKSNLPPSPSYLIPASVAAVALGWVANVFWAYSVLPFLSDETFKVVGSVKSPPFYVPPFLTTPSTWPPHLALLAIGVSALLGFSRSLQLGYIFLDQRTSRRSSSSPVTTSPLSPSLSSPPSKAT